VTPYVQTGCHGALTYSSFLKQSEQYLLKSSFVKLERGNLLCYTACQTRYTKQSGTSHGADTKPQGRKDLSVSSYVPCVLQVHQKTVALEELQCQFRELKDDFLYNEGVLQERDNEIAALESQLRRTTESHASTRTQLHESQLACRAAQSQLLIGRDRFASSARCCHRVKIPSWVKIKQAKTLIFHL
jgi:hypothetical protein